MVASKNEICNLALGHLGDFEVIDIDAPKTKVEFVCARWYDTSRKSALREGCFDFSIKRDIIAMSEASPIFGWIYQASEPSDCLRVLSIGDEIELDKTRIPFMVEKRKILTNEEFADGMPIRYIENIKEVGLFDDDFVEFFALKLARNMAFDLNNDTQLKRDLRDEMAIAKLQASSSSGQESKPVIVSNSRYKNARTSGNYPYKRRIY